MTTDPQTDRPRALHLLEAADFLRDAHFRDGLSVQEIGTALRHMADEADLMVGSLARDGFGLDEIAAMPAAPVAVPPADRAGLRERIAGLFRHPPGVERLGDATPGEIADAVMAALPADASEVHRLALSDALGLGTSAPWDAIRERAAELAGQPAAVDRGAVLREAADLIEARQDRLDAEERAEFTHLDHETVLQGEAVRGMAKMLRRLAVETPGPETQGDVAELTALVRDFLDPNPCSYDHHGYCQAHAAGFGGEPLSCPHARARKLLAPAVEAEHQPADGTPQPDTQAAPPKEPHPTEADLRHALAVLDRFEGRDAAEPVEPAASHATEYRHTCHDQTSAPGRDYECQWCSTLPESLPAVVAEPGKEA